jgi:hypothetical protein
LLLVQNSSGYHPESCNDLKSEGATTTAARMETKVLDNGSAYARVRSQDGQNSVQFLTVRANHERNRETLGSESRGDF